MATVAEAITLLALSQDIVPSQLNGLISTLGVMGPDHQVHFLDLIQESLSNGQMNSAGLYTLSKELEAQLAPERALDYLERSLLQSVR